MMELNPEQQVLLALFVEYSKDIPNMDNITFTSLGMDKEVFNVALDKLNTKGYLNNFSPARGKNNKILVVWLNGVSLSNDAIKAAEDLLDSLKFDNYTPESTSQKIFGTVKEDVKDIIAKYFAELSK